MTNIVQLPQSEPYAFDGTVIKLTKRDYENWARAFHAIPDLSAELMVMDAWYAENLQPGEKWFVRCSTALNKKHQEWKARKDTEQAAEHESQKRGPRKFHSVANTMPVKCTEEELAAFRTRHPQHSSDEVPGWWLSAYRAGRFR